MMLTLTAEYAMKAMACMARVHGTRALRAADLTKLTRIPAHYLSKVLRRMVTAGLLVARKGHGGGFVLARPPGEIRFMDVVAAVADVPKPGGCLFRWSTCVKTNPCVLHDAWSELNDMILNWLRTKTLADIPDGYPFRRAATATASRKPDRI